MSKESCTNCQWRFLEEGKEPCSICVSSDAPVPPSHWEPEGCLVVTDEQPGAKMIFDEVLFGPASILKCECGWVFRGLECMPEECPKCKSIILRHQGLWPEGCLVVTDEKPGQGL